jgi:hypothetical protein
LGEERNCKAWQSRTGMLSKMPRRCPNDSGSMDIKIREENEFPLIEDLPEAERKKFRKWLAFQTVPVNKNKTIGFYVHDYMSWKKRGFNYD